MMKPDLKKILYVEDEKDIQTIAQIALAFEQKKDFDEEFRILLSDRSIHYIHAAGIVQHSATHQPIRMVGANWDVTEKRKADIVKSEFISVVSHELRTPLTSIAGAINLLIDKAQNTLPEKENTLLKIAQANSNRLMELINDILDFEKISSGNIQFKLEKQNLTGLLKKSIALNQSYAEKYNVTLVLADQNNSLVRVDKSRFLQIMSNLISNATKFSTPGKSVSITTEYDKNIVKISVKNEGPGIPLDAQPKIFERFFQVDSSSSRQKGGTGLGLAISKAMIEKMGGEIKFISIPDHETTFTIVLPLMD